jgi:capsular polysaccharide biosynthesis protein
MELRTYWDIIRRRWWLPVGLTLLVAALTLIAQRPWQSRPISYSASMRFNVGIKPERIPGTYTYDRYYTMLTSEYLVDDLGEIVRSQAFAGAVSQRLADQGIAAPAGAIGAVTQPGKLHRILTVSVVWPKEDELRAIADAVTATLTDSTADFFGQFSADEADIRLIDPPVVSVVGRPAREQLDLPLRILLALTAGLGLAFLLDYLDRSVRDRSDVEKLGLKILAEIPRAKRTESDRRTIHMKPE